MAHNPKSAWGSQTDCEKLLDNFSKCSKSLSFADFAAEWRKLHFSLIFCGREPKIELPEFTRELFNIAKSCLFNAPTLAKKIGGLYLIYGLYFKQRTNCKLRLTFNDLKNLNEMMNEIRLAGNKEAEFIFYKLFVNDAFLFCATSSEHVYLSTQKVEDQEVDAVSEPQSDLLELLNSDTLEQLGALHSRYQEIKVAISDPDSQDTSLRTINSSYVSDVIAQMTNLKENIDRSRGTKQHSKVNAKREDTESSSEFSDLDEEDIGSKRRRLKADFFQTSDDTYRLPGGSRATARGKKKKKTLG